MQVLILFVMTGAHSAKQFIVFSETGNKVFVTTLFKTSKNGSKKFQFPTLSHFLNRDKLFSFKK